MSIFSKNSSAQRRDFFNSHMCIKKTETDLVFIYKLEFLMQSAVFQMDDELLSWITKFVDTLSSVWGSNLVGMHNIYFKENRSYVQPRLDPSL
jgi:hypothetical protein